MLYEQSTDSLVNQLPVIKDIYLNLQDYCKKNSSGPDIGFIKYFFRNFSNEDFLSRQVYELYRQADAAWSFVQSRTTSLSKIDIINPSVSVDGWGSESTVILLLCEDVPYLFDSVHMLFESNQMNIHFSQTIIYNVERNDQGELVSSQACSNSDQELMNGSDKVREVLLYLEVSLTVTEDLIRHLKTELNDLVEKINCVRNDAPYMREIVSRLAESLPSSNKESPVVGDFLQWLLDDNFIFIGHKDYDLTNNSKPKIMQNKGCSLGVAKSDQEKNSHNSSDLKYISSYTLAAQDFIQQPLVITFSRSASLSTIVSADYPVYIAIRKIDDDNRVSGEYGFLGFFTPKVYRQEAKNIPIVGSKIEDVIHQSGIYLESRQGRRLVDLLDNFPRQELFQLSSNVIFSIAEKIIYLNSESSIKLFLHGDTLNKFISGFICIDKDIYTRDLHKKTMAILRESLQALDASESTYSDDSGWVRIFCTVRTDLALPSNADIEDLEQCLIDAASTWYEKLYQGLLLIDEQAIAKQINQDSFPLSYQEAYSASYAISDIKYLTSTNAISFRLNHEANSGINQLSLYHEKTVLPLSWLVPVLENMGLHVIGEQVYTIKFSGQEDKWVHGLSIAPNTVEVGDDVSIENLEALFASTIEAIWRGDANNDKFNLLIPALAVSWRKVCLFRAYAAYIKQIGINYSARYIAETLLRYKQLTTLLLDYFYVKFDPEIGLSIEQRRRQLEELEQRFIDGLERLDNLGEDTILRLLLDLNKAMVRVNYFQLSNECEAKSYFSFKLIPAKINGIPQPCPAFEVFVFSARMEGVHLRYGLAARGGLRWSDRLEDYRTEIVGLAKAQQVKNAVIVPVGAKGGFVAKRANNLSDKDALLAEGVTCYSVFISGLLDITDSINNKQIETPAKLVCYDNVDPYLVVAADKGTARFSDISNAISEDYNFWLGDAFASGGSNGYDHKQMGITAKGAWVSVQQHFRERSINIQHNDFTVIGIGDMSGDVFGNGLLLSRHIQLVAAFNHEHIFVDPDPDSAISFIERERLFDLDRSSWSDYNPKFISNGGGVYKRSLKEIKITAEMKSRFSITESKLTPDELIKRLLCSKVDLLWNGGIGTYIKASSETDFETGDRFNDRVRVNACDVNAAVIGEGGNLGISQLARIEYANKGGAINTDFIDNAAGVNCSDHEVNIKILLNGLSVSGDLSTVERNSLLASMTEEVSAQVLADNFQQALAISMESTSSLERMPLYLEFIHGLEEKGMLNRALEFLPTDQQFQTLIDEGRSLTRPEIAILLCYNKIVLKQDLLTDEIVDDSHLGVMLNSAFPSTLLHQYPQAIQTHKLKREIIATQWANHIVNRMGINFVDGICRAMGVCPIDVLKAYASAINIFDIDNYWQQINKLKDSVQESILMDMRIELVKLVNQSTQWLLKQNLHLLTVDQLIMKLASDVQGMCKLIPTFICDDYLQQWQYDSSGLIEHGVPLELANYIATLPHMHNSLGIVDAVASTSVTVEQAAQLFYKFDLSRQAVANA